ncbi:arginine repressor [Treponema phagedenis]|uniref:arginine repressor n=1 Tax=Treponema phagedenis TaxID=162 RepID=UPI00197E5803|nr:ArgR family transcriptional regulator [Treponema phagedenis]QSH93516.1 ArgR family transcriptional regulator [Treponema phagedenis]
MKQRLARLKTIRKLIKSYPIESQEMLLGYLDREGFSVTQATLSRDLKMLKVSKISDGKDGYVYMLPSEDEKTESEATGAQDFLRGYVSIDYSGNMVVIKTYPGYTDVVSIALENMNMESILGIIAGRINSIFVCLKDGIYGDAFIAELKQKIPEIDE